MSPRNSVVVLAGLVTIYAMIECILHRTDSQDVLDRFDGHSSEEDGPFSAVQHDLQSDEVLTITPDMLDVKIRESIDVPDNINYQDIILDLIHIRTMQNKHELNKLNNTNPEMKPILLIIEPALFFDIEPIIPSYELNQTLNRSEWSELVRIYNKNTLKFSFGAENSDEIEIYAYRQDLMVFISWMHRLSTSMKIPIEIVAYSNKLPPNQLIYHINLITVYYNTIANPNENTDEWFKFIAAMTIKSTPKSFQSLFIIFLSIY